MMQPAALPLLADQALAKEAATARKNRARQKRALANGLSIAIPDEARNKFAREGA
jgi:hypothetical protein